MTIKPQRQFRAAGLALLAAAAMALSAAPAHALAINSVKKCKTISKAGYYQLTQDLALAGAGVCLRITGNNVIVNFNGHNLMGSGGGTGILIAGKNVFIDADEGAIADFAIGIEDDGDNAIVENFGVQNSSDILGPSKGRVLALGPLAGKTITIAGRPILFTVKYELEFAAQNRSSGNELWATAAYQF